MRPVLVCETQRVGLQIHGHDARGRRGREDLDGHVSKAAEADHDAGASWCERMTDLCDSSDTASVQRP